MAVGGFDKFEGGFYGLIGSDVYLEDGYSAEEARGRLDIAGGRGTAREGAAP